MRSAYLHQGATDCGFRKLVLLIKNLNKNSLLYNMAQI